MMTETVADKPRFNTEKQASGKVTISCGTKFHSDHVAYQLSRHGMLHQVLTAHPEKYYLNRVPIERKYVRFLLPVFLLGYGVRRVLGPTSVIYNYLNYRLPLLYDRMAARLIPDKTVLLTWAWSGLNTIKQTKKRGGIAIVEECGSCSQFQNELLAEEYKSLGLTFQQPTPQFIVDRQLEEARLADYLLCPSRHVANSFVKHGIDAAKCRVIPYGANVDHFKPIQVEQNGFHVLFVGTVGVRKGLIYLLQALEQLSEKHPVRCTLIGSMESAFRPLFEKYAHLVTHISHVPHEQLVNYYATASVFVFPSLDEGMALVQLEALACGVPVICTTNSGGDAAVEEGVEGFVIPVRDPQAIADRIETLLLQPGLRDQMAKSARNKALSFSWERYGDHLSSFIQWAIKAKECV